jgi:hypothetical protein
LSDARHNYSREQREQVIQEISQIEGLIQDARGLESFAFPKPSSPALDYVLKVLIAEANTLEVKRALDIRIPPTLAGREGQSHSI